ncbi:hypothetical protein QJS10_CPB19g00634 [Acorus calamus]|uniref:RNase H type-1 domain-containing protein n=1 Tax=Acorus calamus TaxID=4465 RepID=A0AAV9CEV5_ACOCL|nr:hypothetical protein QJS10_CPB19g00634 [Acorus calamus]
MASRSWIAAKARYIIFDGSSINIWYDPWLNGKSLRDLIGSELLIWAPPHSTPLSVLIQEEKWCKPARWHSDLDVFWEEIKLLEVGETGPDILVWLSSRTGGLSLSDGWRAQSPTVNPVVWAEWLWPLVQSRKHCFTVWQFFLDKLPTKDGLLRKAVITPNIQRIVDSFGITITKPVKSQCTVSWNPPTTGWIKSNSDGSLSDDRGGYGAPLRDANANLLVGVAGRSHLPSINLLELKGIEAGLFLSIRHGFNRVWFESDSTTAIAWMKGRGRVPWTAIRLLRKISHGLRSLEEWKITHIFREGNSPADILAATRQTIGEHLITPHQVWQELAEAIESDKVPLQVASLRVRDKGKQQDARNDKEIEPYQCKRTRKCYCCHALESAGAPESNFQRSTSFWFNVTKQLDAFYRFCRPHTIIGTIVGVTSVSLLPIQSMADIPRVFLGLLKVLIPAVLMNVYVVGLNQLYDIEVDKKYTLGRPIVFTRSLISATAFMCFFSVVIALFKANKIHVGIEHGLSLNFTALYM